MAPWLSLGVLVAIAAPETVPLPVSDTLVLQGIPAPERAVADRVKQYIDSRSAVVHDLLPDGSGVLIGTRFASTPQVHFVSTPGGARTQLTFREEPAAQVSFVPGNANALTYVSDRGGDENFQIFRLDLDTGRTSRLTDFAGRVEGYIWSHQGDRIAYFHSGRNGRDTDLYLGNGRDATGERRVAELDGTWMGLDWSPDGARLLVQHYISVEHNPLFVVDIATGQMTPIGDPAAKVANPTALFGADGQTVWVVSDREGDFASLYRADVGSGSFTAVTPSLAWDIEELSLSPDGRTLALNVNEDAWSALYLLDTRTERLTKAQGLPAGIYSDVQYAADAARIGLTIASPNDTADAWTWDPKSRAATRWTTSEMGGLRRENLVKPTSFRYKTFDNRDIPAFIYRPASLAPGARAPVVINIHGGPEGQSRPYFSALAQYLASEAGIAMVYPNVRGSTGYGKSWVSLDNGLFRENSVKDIGALLDWIAKDPTLDPENVAVIGGSYGGYMVLASLTTFPERIRAGIDVVGISNFVTFLENTKDYRRDLRRVEYGDERIPSMRSFLENISPVNRLDRLNSALFVAHGANDPRVPVGEAEQVVAAAQARGLSPWYMLAKNEGHGFNRKENRDLFTLLQATFLQQHLGKK